MQTFLNSVESLNSQVYSAPPCKLKKFKEKSVQQTKTLPHEAAKHITLRDSKTAKNDVVRRLLLMAEVRR